MNSVKITLPKRLSKVEILSSKDLASEDYFQYLPLTKVPVETYSPDVFDEEIAKLRDVEYEKDIFETLDIPIQQTFYRELVFSDQTKPIKISLDKLPKETILLSEAQKKIQESYDLGFKEGQEITEDHFKEEINRQQSWLSVFENLSLELREQYSKEIHNLAESVVPISIEIAKHIIGRELQADNNLFIEQLKKTLAEIDNETIFKIYINPKNLKTLENAKNDVFMGYDISNISIEANDNIDLLACVLETSTGKFDSTIESQLNRIAEKLNKVPIENEADDLLKTK